jgi:hypothetical protein
MKTPDEGAFAAALRRRSTRTSVLRWTGVRECRRAFRGLRVRPTIEVDSAGRSLQLPARRRKTDIDETIEAPARAPGRARRRRKRRVVIVFDEFQEILALDAASRT